MINFRMNTKKQGFTLIELLVVIAIIATLVALASGGLSAAKRKARSTKCLSNLRQLGISVRMYADDNKERFPRIERESGATNLASISGLRKVLESYVGTKSEVFLCPEDEDDARLQRGESSYEWNSSLNGRLIDRKSYGTGHEANANSTVLLSDREPWHGFKNAVFSDGSANKIK